MRPTLLIVDDNEAILKLLTVVFERKYNVYTAADGVEAIAFLSEAIMPDLIISDLHMNNISGYELVRHLSTSNLYNKIPVVIISDATDPDLALLGAQSVVVAVLHKPFDPVALARIVEESIVKYPSGNNYLRVSAGYEFAQRYNQSFSKS
ncbi:response regulator [Deminuibacter soli]|uniref:Response regulator n=1 Tax=Deminuibacter soli TaxID=2291815 RepID=A0A3E1NQI9_9BACT|nr:response regulator [Deminuibacter soli]RFM30183.1 response regulator [Deminuibacter soli]